MLAMAGKPGLLRIGLITANLMGVMAVFGATGVLAYGVNTQNSYRQDPVSTPSTSQGELRKDCYLVSPYVGIINEAAKQYGIPASYIAAIIEQESGGRPRAGSGAGAKGLMQLLDGTFTEVRSRSLTIKADGAERTVSAAKNAAGTDLPADIYDPEANIYAGTQYITQQIQTFGFFPIALAAYNAGPGNVQYYGNAVPPFTETIQYVYRITQLHEPKYRTCLETETTTGVDSSGMHPNIQKLIDQFNSNPAAYAQTPGQCAQFTEKLLVDTFGAGMYARPGTLDNNRTRQDGLAAPPSQSDLREARDHLAKGHPVQWHVTGEGCGTHWIVLLKIEGTQITFYDPNGGRIRTEAHDMQRDTSLGRGAYFGVSPISFQAKKRGFYYTP